jgi:hypothetical protein
VITFFSIPKPFDGHTGVIQRNAIGSWLRVHPEAQVILLGDEAGTAETAQRLGADHEPRLERNAHGTPLLDDAFRIAAAQRRNPLLCYVNADIVLPASLTKAAFVASAASKQFLVIGECWNQRVETELDLDRLDWPALLNGARKRGADAIDYFLYTPGVYDDIPAFAVGRLAFDNWLVWKARRTAGTRVIDATWVVRPLHEDHAYGHVGTLSALRSSSEAAENSRLAGGGRGHLYSRFDATDRLTAVGLVPNPLGVAHIGESARRAWAKLAYATGMRRP